MDIRYKVNKLLLHVACLLLLGAVACTNKFDDYYNSNEYQGKTLMQVLEAEPDFSEFLALVKEAGYDSLLNSSRSYTLFVPVNGSFATVNHSNIDSLRMLVGTHIVPSSIYDHAITGKRVQTLSGKYILLEKPDGLPQFDGISLTVVNMRAKNGVVHKLADRVKLKQSLYDILKSSPAFSVFYSYIRGNSAMIFDPALSTVVGVDSIGRTVYDTVLTRQNYYLNLTKIDKEATQASLFIPTNDLYYSFLNNEFRTALGSDATKLTSADTSRFRYNFFRHIAVMNTAVKTTGLASALTSALGTRLSVGATDLAQGDVVASNGVAHVLNSIKPVDYLFQRSVTVSAQDINLLKLDKAVFPASVVSRQIVKAGVYTTTGVFQFSLYGAGRSVTVDLCEYLPKSATPLDWRGIPAGYYNVYLNFFSDATCCSFDVAYNGKNINSSVIYGATYRPTVRQNLLLGTIYVTALGKVTLKFIDNARSTAHNLYIDNIRLEPVIAP